MAVLTRKCAPFLAALVFALTPALPARAARVQDIASVGGVRDNALIGYGLVVGLNQTGDQTSQTPFTVQSLRNMLFKLGVNIPANTNDLQLRDVAAVAVRASLPPFVKPGQKIDVTVSALGSATSLGGGTLLMTPLKGVDGETYAIAQGSVVVAGFGASAANGTSVSVNDPDAGSIPDGAIVERALPNEFDRTAVITLNLHQADFTTASRLANAINEDLGTAAAQAIDPVTVQVQAPTNPGQRVAFVSRIEQLEVTPGSVPARVVINSGTGTIVIGQHVRVSAAAVAHGSLTVAILQTPEVSQPAPFSKGRTTTVIRASIRASQPKAHLFMIPDSVSLEQIVTAMNQIGATPNDLIAILEALKAAGALHANLVVQ
ncbi:MAG: flagellar basal body P-ring protein FlgI [Rhodanobacteraceae bacterium]